MAVLPQANPSMFFVDTSAALLLTLAFLCVHDLEPNNLLNDSNILRFALYNTLQVLQAVTQILDLALIEVLCASNIFLYKEACAYIHQHMFMIREFPRYV